MARLPDPGTVRGAITREILYHCGLLVPPVLEAGAHRPAHAWWADFRAQLGFKQQEWVGTDMHAGNGVDIVANLCSEAMPLPMATFGSVLCAETLEHVRDPHRALRNLEMAMRGGAWILVTVPFAFPVHNYPDDYWRFTPSGLAMLLEDAGFTDIETRGFNEFTMPLRDHLDDEPVAQRVVPMHVFGRARCP